MIVNYNQIPLTYVPPLYRYLESQYVENFFTMGILRISSFEHFANHPDETRLDTQEGRAKLIGNFEDNNGKLEMDYGVGNSFVLCASLIKSQCLADKFKTDACFKIKDFFLFYSCIWNELTKRKYMILDGIHRACKYTDTDKRELVSEVKQKDVDKIKDLKYYDQMFEQGRKIAKQDIYFLKQNNYVQEHEYRMIWFPDVNINIPKTIDLCVPEAVQFCERVPL